MTLYHPMNEPGHPDPEGARRARCTCPFDDEGDCPIHAEPAPTLLNQRQEEAAKTWAANDRLWTTQETVEFNLRTFARVILKAATSPFVPSETAEETR